MSADRSTNENPEGRKAGKLPPRLSLILFPLVILLFLLVYGYFESQGKFTSLSVTHYLQLNWRNGLTFGLTIWDPILFWENFLPNLALGILFAGAFLYRVPASSEAAWKHDAIRTKKIFLGATLTCVILLISMGFSMLQFSPARLSLIAFPTRMAYEIWVWPAIIAGVFLLVAPLKKISQKRNTIQAAPNSDIDATNSNRKKIVAGFGILFLLVWLFMVAPTLWHPHAFFNFYYQAYVFLTTLIFPASFFVFLGTLLVTDPPHKRDGRRFAKRELLLTGGALLILIVLQLILLFQETRWTNSSLFVIDILWWWPVAFWPSWCFSIALGLGLVTGVRLLVLNRSALPRLIDAVWTGANKILARKRVKPIVVASLCAAFIVPPIAGTLVFYSQQPENTTMLLVNQLGYRPDSPKRVLLQMRQYGTVPDTTPFSVWRVNKSSGTPNLSLAYEDNLTKTVWKYGHWYMEGNFTPLRDPGTYRVKVSLRGTTYWSFSFQIEDPVYDRALELALRFFYYQRSGYEVQEVVDGFPGHGASHLDDANIWDGEKWVWRNLTGGWYDAGDYNKHQSWFQTQWYCVQALAEALEYDVAGFYGKIPDLYDSTGPDVLDEALWGAHFMYKCIDMEALIPGGTPGMVFCTVGGWNYKENTTAYMSYWGPPDRNTDNIPGTGDERTVSSMAPWDQDARWKTTPWGYIAPYMAYAYCGTFLQLARVVDQYTTNHPGYQLPSWAPNSTALREAATIINATHAPLSPKLEDNTKDQWYLIGRTRYEWEVANLTGDYTTAEAWTQLSWDLIPDETSSWQHATAFAQHLNFYLKFGRPVPGWMLDRIDRWREKTYPKYYLGPFYVRHLPANYGDWDNSEGYGTEMLLFHKLGEAISTDFTFLWLEGVMAAVRPGGTRADLLQSQLDYMFGVNPLGMCMMIGVSPYGQEPAQLHHRFSYAYYPSGKVPGSIVNRFIREQPSKDYCMVNGISEGECWRVHAEEAHIDTWPNNPIFSDGVDSSCNEIWIPHNAMFLKMMAAINRYALL